MTITKYEEFYNSEQVYRHGALEFFSAISSVENEAAGSAKYTMDITNYVLLLICFCQ